MANTGGAYLTEQPAPGETVPVGKEPLAVIALKPLVALQFALGPLSVAIVALCRTYVVRSVVIPNTTGGAVVVVLEEPGNKLGNLSQSVGVITVY